MRSQKQEIIIEMKTYFYVFVQRVNKVSHEILIH